MRRRLLLHLLVFCTLAAMSSSAGAQGALSYEVPDGWTAAPASSSMRVAEFTLPRADGDPEDGEAVIYYFQGAGGSVQANLDRWTDQMLQPDGRSSRDLATTQQLTVNGLAVTQVDVSGTYVAEIMPGQSADRHHKPDYRLVAAVIETAAGPYFLKISGPRDTIGRWEDSIAAFVGSMEYE